MEIKEEQIPINDGSGIYDRNGMIDGLIVDCENVMKSIMAGEGIQLAAILVEMVQKLSTLKKGVAEEVKNLTEERDLARKNADENAKALIRRCPPEQKPPDQTDHKNDGYWEDV